VTQHVDTAANSTWNRSEMAAFTVCCAYTYIHTQGESIRERESAAIEAAIWRDVAALELEVAHWARLIVLRSQVLIVSQHY
jgi:hypothetical protein